MIAAQEGHNPLGILQVVPRLDTGGVERGTLEIVEAIVAAGGRAVVATTGGQMVPRMLRAGAEIFEMNLATKNPFNIWQNAGLLARLIREERIDLVHARSRAPAWSAYLASRRCNVPFVTTYHGTYNEDLPFKRFYNAVMAKGRPVIAVSEFIGQLVAERHRVREEDIVVIPRGADISVFSEDAVSAERTVALAERWGILDDPRPVILLPARLTRWKGHEGLIEAAALLRKRRGADFLILLVGDGGEDWYARALENRIKSHGLEQQVWLTGGCTDMAAAYKVASVVVSASTDPEAFGRVVVEAQAMGRPVIATDHGGARETVVHGETGWLYPPGDVARLAETLDAALKLDPSERAHMGLAARARVHARYTVKAMQRATIDVYERAAGRSFGVSL
ncbi:glycosyltransferase family 4 protein [Paralimibaculum aggregatum]|uniref:Glycosyltransferase family 4 protein n=1 Tax=Paralimibaculum aggregatum TaxID=3036245 RepID=A0ABQ6LL62_9RHOB|nr:glycosyltransferase family 4 protein [Limibaculum sp. NKW23]GMG83019.1 glycosyltransferase family 4 protein [Limibaculum sp. NKW23]